MILNQENLKNIAPTNVQVPTADSRQLPEKVLQFGTGVLLRGLPDYFIHQANQAGMFNGRIVVVKSTDHGDTSAFEQQDNLYTLCVRGIENGQTVEENIICSAISRVVSASTQWPEILKFAASPDLTVVISNTTEVGIQLVEDSIQAQLPVSFPGKLVAVLRARYQAFAGDPSKGLVIVPTELIPDNGTKLKDIVYQLAQQLEAEPGFRKWLDTSIIFCNTLVDRIVPGKPDPEKLAALEQELGYHDELLTMSEVYRLWAIAGDEKVQEVLSFAPVDAGIIIAPDIDIYRELKLRLLNGTHTLSCGVAFLANQVTVKQAMGQELVAGFISSLMQNEIAPAIPYPVEPAVSLDFSRKVLDRFRNPHLEHQWLSITMNYTSKLKMRVIPVLLKYYELFNQVPQQIAFGFAAYLQFMRATSIENNKYYGKLAGEKYLINDDQALLLHTYWQQATPAVVTQQALQNPDLWGADLTTLPGFAPTVAAYLTQIQEAGIAQALQHVVAKKTVVS
ncbi:tagaturonate reductase [Adhaeribacter pallidiroseus]|uniref:Tagaturonate reductase n=1 Tax=Adhaeribacter pallidiroseus TaxID=2072847 RepID=A0A369QB56_9BACT|nr:tagaturonate reductase [Adhaeribacter pallidiroseus]RDC61944.1 Tagaturonate reductase [Adhaeribacter pallidiroseus]